MSQNAHHKLVLTFLLVALTSKINSKPPDYRSETAEYRQQQTARLHEFIRIQPASRERVAPVQFVQIDDIKKWTVMVHVNMHLINVRSIDEVKQTMTSVLVYKVNWFDPSLKWDPEEFGGVDMVELPLNSIWLPPLVTLNSPDFTDILNSLQQINVHSTGRVSCTGVFEKETTCRLDHSHFPYDSQNCPFMIASSSFLVDLQITYTAVRYMVSPAFSQPDWHVIGVKTVNISFTKNSKPMLLMLVMLKRSVTFYTMCLVVPMVLTSYMNTLVFLVPLQSGEKISYLITIFVSTSVYTSVFDHDMPRGLSKVPATMILLIGVVVESFSVLLATLCVLQVEERNLARSQRQKLSKHSPKDTDVPLLKRRTKCDCGGYIGKVLVKISHHANRCQWTAKSPNNLYFRHVFFLTAQRLDTIFFAVFFISNTLFLLVLYFK